MSFAATLTTDTKTIRNPSWADVEREIRALDSVRQTLVMLAPPSPKGVPEGDHHLAVGGAADDRLIVYVTEDNLHFWNLVDPARRMGTRKTRIIIGGQEGEYRESQFVTRDCALRAAREYFEHGRRSADLTWTTD